MAVCAKPRAIYVSKMYSRRENGTPIGLQCFRYRAIFGYRVHVPVAASRV